MAGAMSLINADAQAVIERIRAVDQTVPYRLQTARIEGALLAYLKALKQPERPIRWVTGCKAGILDVFEKARDAAWGAAWDAARGATRDAAWDAAWDAARGAAWDAARDAAWDAAWGATRDAARDAAWDAARDATRGAAWDAARGATRDAAWDAAWGAALIAGVPKDHPRYQEWCEIFLPLIKAFEDGLFIYWVRKEEIVAVPRPVFSFRENQLHGDGKPAIEFPNGERYYFWRGVAIPKEWGKLNSEHWQPKWLLETKNAEQRRVLIQGLGYERIMKSLDSTIIHREQDMELRRIEASVDVEPIVLLKVVCPSTDKTYTLRVPPEMTDCEQARRWTLHLTTKDVLVKET